jgi:N-acetylglucosaminyl-diphospho-decaprenol L-rhamnosyltransferase
LPELSISIVSHRQIQLVQMLLADIRQHCCSTSIEVILTVNVDEPLPFSTQDYEFPIRIIHNAVPKGFGENHNAAFQLATGNFFCVLNPDIRFSSNPFSALIAQVRNANVGLVAPLVTSVEGVPEDSARQFPSPFEIVRKVFGGKSATHTGILQPISNPDWVAGMFMLFPRHVFQEIGGFDDRFFLYYEDVDLCARLTLANYTIVLCSTVSVVHDARRSSHKSLRYMRMHLTSMLRFFFSSVYRQLRQRPPN